MKKIEDIVDKPLADIADEFFEEINRRTKAGEYYKDESIIGRIKTAIDLGDTLQPFYVYLLDEANDYSFLKKIITSPPLELESLITTIGTKLTHLNIVLDKTNTAKIIATLNYKNIRKNKTNWLLDRLKIKTCPYCTTQFLLKFESATKKEKKSLCELDHFYPKEQYPYLSVSFYNLIPSCSPCNRSKGKKPTTIATFIHPYIHDYNTLCKFKTETASIIYNIIKSKTPIDIKLQSVKGISTSDEARTTNHNERFNLKEIYTNHSDIAEELYWRKYVYTTKRRRDLLKIFKGRLGLTQAEIDRFITGNYMNDNDLLKRPLAKLVKDISEEIKLIP